jgi:hypothetical protein
MRNAVTHVIILGWASPVASAVAAIVAIEVFRILSRRSGLPPTMK